MILVCFMSWLWPGLIMLWYDCFQHVKIHRLAYQAFEGLYGAQISFHVGSAQWKITGGVYTFYGYPSLGSSMWVHPIWVRSSPLADCIDPALFFAKQVTPWKNALECRLNWADKKQVLLGSPEGVALCGQFCLDRCRPVIIQACQFLWPGIVNAPFSYLLCWRLDFYHCLSAYLFLSFCFSNSWNLPKWEPGIWNFCPWLGPELYIWIFCPWLGPELCIWIFCPWLGLELCIYIYIYWTPKRGAAYVQWLRPPKKACLGPGVAVPFPPTYVVWLCPPSRAPLAVGGALMAQGGFYFLIFFGGWCFWGIWEVVQNRCFRYHQVHPSIQGDTDSNGPRSVNFLVGQEYPKYSTKRDILKIWPPPNWMVQPVPGPYLWDDSEAANRNASFHL